MPGSPQWSLSLRFLHQNPVLTSSLPHTHYMPRPSHSSRFYHSQNITKLLAPHPPPKLEDHASSAVRDCLFNIFAATLHIGGCSSIRNVPCRGYHRQVSWYLALSFS
jgi:hypothetical protein